MALIPLTPLLRDAERGGYAIPALNYCNTESAQAVVAEAEALRSPAVLIVGPWEIPLVGLPALAQIAAFLASQASIPVCLHLDHATDLDLVCRAVEAGFPSVMLDGSQHEYEENVRLTREAAEFAHARGVSLEGELGAVGRVDAATPEGTATSALTDPDQAADFVARTGVDILAVAIGNAHGMYTRQPTLDFERLAAIRRATRVPLVLHGGSGTPPEQLREAIRLGISKVNVASECSRAFLDAIEQARVRNEGNIWWAHALIEAKAALRVVAGRWMRQLGSAGRVD